MSETTKGEKLPYLLFGMECYVNPRVKLDEAVIGYVDELGNFKPGAVRIINVKPTSPAPSKPK